MSEKELEERVLINKSQYLEIEKYLKDNFPFVKLIHQKNRYLDDQNQTIRKGKNMLRIRSLTNSPNRQLTYKVAGQDGDLEYTQLLSYYWFNKVVHESRLPEGEVKNQLSKDGVDTTSMKVIVDLKTRRMEVELEDHTFVLDANMYNGIIDYDIEVESKISKEHALHVILDYCQRFNLEYKNDYPTKSNRAFASIK